MSCPKLFFGQQEENYTYPLTPSRGSESRTLANICIHIPGGAYQAHCLTYVFSAPLPSQAIAAFQRTAWIPPWSSVNLTIIIPSTEQFVIYLVDNDESTMAEHRLICSSNITVYRAIYVHMITPFFGV